MTRALLCVLCWSMYTAAAQVTVRVDPKAYTFVVDGQPLLCYNHATVYPPPGVDSAFKRSGFIHPLWTPHGQVLTRIQPPDHYHHYGLWNPWTHVLFQGDTVDFWNLGDKKGFVRFAKLLSIDKGPGYAQIKILHEHVVVKTQQTAIKEVQTIRVYQPKDDAYAIDIISELTCATDSPVLLLTYRYGGLGWRATEAWNRDNSEVLTSEGRDRKTADGSTARWCVVQGALGEERGGMLLLSAPSNYNHPEPLRIWPDNSNGKGDLFVNFSPTKNKDWLLEPGKTYTLRYRLVVFNGTFDSARAEKAWREFADTVHAQVVYWNGALSLLGHTAYLDDLDIHTGTLSPGAASGITPETDALLIVKSGSAEARIHGQTKRLSPGGVALVLAGDALALSNTGDRDAVYYVLSFTHTGPRQVPGASLLLDWTDLPVQTTSKGETRQVFSEATAQFAKIDMHVTTLNAGEVSHPPHTHPQEEIILLRSGNVEMQIGNKFYPAGPGDLVFLTSEIPHALRNTGQTPAQYYALQWR